MYCSNSSSDSGQWLVGLDSSGVVNFAAADKYVFGRPSTAGSIYPYTTNKLSCGTSSNAWTQVYANTTTISTSDRNKKKDLRSFDSNENYEKFFMDLKPVIYKFKYNESDRDHFGYISQDVEESLYKYGFDDKSFAGFCKDVRVKEVEVEGKTEQVPDLDDNGNKQYDYALRYSEFISMNTWMIQKVVKENQELKAQISEIKEYLAELKG
jgi:hypothetical protein